MNRYPRGGPSRANPDTLCQKCLQRGHYSYECKASAADRPYAARPSRTQQLLNPKHAPKLSEVAPPLDLTRKQGVADEILAKKEEERGRKRRRVNDLDKPASRSASESSLSVSTISTGRSRSPSPPQTQHSSKTRDGLKRRTSHSRSDRKEHHRRRRKSPSRSSRPHEDVDRVQNTQSSNRSKRGDSRSKSDRAHQRSLRSPSPQRSRSHSSEGVRQQQQQKKDTRYGGSPYEEELSQPQRSRQDQFPRQRSLSPYSKRLALTQAMNR